MRKLKSFLASALVPISIISSITPAFAERADVITINEAGSLSSDVTYTLDSAFTASIPKKIILDNNKSAIYHVNVTGDIYGDQIITVTPDAEITLKDANGKGNVTATVTQDDTVFEYTDIKAVNESGTAVGKTVEGNITAEDLTAGKWQGILNFNINAEINSNVSYGVGLYTLDGEEVASWEEFKATVNNYISEKELSGYEVSDAKLNVSAKTIQAVYPDDNLVLTVPEGITNVYMSGGNSGNTNLVKLFLSDTVETAYCYNWRKATELKLPDSIKTIPSSAFGEWYSLKSVTYKGIKYTSASSLIAALKENNVEIGNYIFEDSSDFFFLDYEGEQTAPDSIEEYFNITDDGTLSLSPYADDVYNYANGYSSSSSICRYGKYYDAFHNIVSLVIPNEINGIQVKKLDNNMFNSLEKLVEVTIPKSVVDIGDNFNSCPSLTNIIVSSDNINYTSENGVLFNKDKATLVKYPEGKTDSTYTIPNSVTHINSVRNTNLTEIIFSDGIKSITGNAIFASCKNLTSITIPESVTNIDDYVFYGLYIKNFTNNSSLNAEENNYWGVTVYDEYIDGMYIKNNILITSDVVRNQSSDSLNGSTNIIIPNTITAINNEVFRSGYVGSGLLLDSLTIPNSVVSIAPHAFTDVFVKTDGFINNSSLNAEENDYWGATVYDYTINNNIYIKNNVIIDILDPYAESLYNLSIPEGIAEIKEYAFRDARIKTLMIPNSVITIGSYAFEYNRNLTNVTLSDNIENIGYNAFYGCEKLSTVIYKGTTYTSKSELISALETNNVIVYPSAFDNTKLS